MLVSRVGGAHRLSGFVCAVSFLAMVVITLNAGVLAAQATGEQRAADDLGIQWIEVESGTFTMGRGAGARQVTVRPFMMSATEVTFGQYDAFCDATEKRRPDDSGWGRGARPVLNVSYDDAVEFCQWLSGETGSAVRLPNEAEWEYAAQGGRHSKGYFHSGGNDHDEVCWNEDNSGGRTQPVGKKRPNELGLYDMSGNVWEWCADWRETNGSESQADPPEPGSGVERAARGSSFDNPGSSMGYRLSVRIHRDSRHINIGFRVAKSG